MKNHLPNLVIVADLRASRGRIPRIVGAEAGIVRRNGFISAMFADPIAETNFADLTTEMTSASGSQGDQLSS